MGALFAPDNDIGVSGICHGADPVFASSRGNNLLDCLIKSVETLEPGDVLVLAVQAIEEVSGNSFPIEANPMVHYMCEMAVAKGIVVVAAAGNGSRNLDELTDESEQLIWPPISDSGSIIVGAGEPTLPDSSLVPRSRHNSSNYGSRVNCQGWGRKVASTRADRTSTPDVIEHYTDNHFGTSAATAMVAGAIACLQSIYKARFPDDHRIPVAERVLSPAKLRELVSDDANGTPQQSSPTSPDTERIGPLPDLKKLIARLDSRELA